MAAIRESISPAGSSPAQVVDLRELPPGALAAVLEEETECWRAQLDWDFRASAGLVAHFHELRALNGAALLVDGVAAGYTYFVAEERKGLIGDLYIERRFRSAANQTLLLGAALDQLLRLPHIRRVESQLMMILAPRLSQMPHRKYVRIHNRLFLEYDLAKTAALPQGAAARRTTIVNWTERKEHEAAAVISSAYKGHVDSDINDQYRSPAGAHKFLSNIVQYPGCGTFFQPASFLALDDGGRAAGLCLSSLVAGDVGHITQICVTPELRGSGAGYELLRRSLEALHHSGCRMASLTVTAANTEAVRLYERIGFVPRREFAALVWDGLPPARS